MSCTYVDISIRQSSQMANKYKMYINVYTPCKLISSTQGYDMNVYISFDSIYIEKTIFQNIIPLPKQKVMIELNLFDKKKIKLRRTTKDVYLLCPYGLFKEKDRYVYDSNCLYRFLDEDNKFIDKQTEEIESM